MTGNRHYTGDRAALGRFETFLFSAVATVVLVRAFLIVRPTSSLFHGALGGCRGTRAIAMDEKHPRRSLLHYGCPGSGRRSSPAEATCD